MASSKSIIANLNNGNKLSERNYDIWHRQIEYLLEEQEILETITQPMIEPDQETLLSTGLIWKHIKLISARTI
jgi:hypothetical protein